MGHFPCTTNRTPSRQVPRVDIILDDGGHKPQHQNATLIGAFPHLSPGGVYLCEDVHKPGNEHANFVWRNFVDGKDGINDTPSEFAAKGRRASYVQQYAAEVSFYPYIVVIEKAAKPLRGVRPELHGTGRATFRTQAQKRVGAHEVTAPRPPP